MAWDAVTLARRVAGSRLREVFSAPPRTLEAIARGSDEGLFGPSSMAWKLHAHPSALVGGVRSLIVQTMHPLAMAGVADHSNYRADPLGRLQRTAGFVAATTYGSRGQAVAAVAAVRRAHERVRGVAPDGRPYYANDPALLAWAHHVEVESFLLAYQRVGPGLSPAQADQYVEEMARLGELMGARPVLTDWKALHEWVLHHPDACATDEARSAVRFLVTLPLPVAARPAYAIVLGAAISLVPLRWRLALRLPVPGPLTGRLVSEPAARACAAAMAWALGPSPALATARARLAAGGRPQASSRRDR